MLQAEMINLLLLADADVNETNDRHKTALMAVAQMDQISVAQLLIGEGADIHYATVAKVQVADMNNRTACNYLDSNSRLQDSGRTTLMKALCQ